MIKCVLVAVFLTSGVMTYPLADFSEPGVAAELSPLPQIRPENVPSVPAVVQDQVAKVLLESPEKAAAQELAPVPQEAAQVELASPPQPTQEAVVPVAQEELVSPLVAQLPQEADVSVVLQQAAVTQLEEVVAQDASQNHPVLVEKPVEPAPPVDPQVLSSEPKIVLADIPESAPQPAVVDPVKEVVQQVAAAGIPDVAELAPAAVEKEAPAELATVPILPEVTPVENKLEEDDRAPSGNELESKSLPEEPSEAIASVQEESAQVLSIAPQAPALPPQEPAVPVPESKEAAVEIAEQDKTGSPLPESQTSVVEQPAGAPAVIAVESVQPSAVSLPELPVLQDESAAIAASVPEPVVLQENAPVAADASPAQLEPEIPAALPPQAASEPSSSQESSPSEESSASAEKLPEPSPSSASS